MSLQQDIDRGLEIVSALEELKKELGEITTRIERAALNGPQVPLEDPERDGMQYLAKGSERIVPVVITADYLAGSFTNLSDKHLEILKTLPNREPLLVDFYQPKVKFERVIEDGKAFRKLAREMLGDEAEAFIKACVSRDKFGIPKNATKIAWDRARESEVAK
jgi:hypothetical protein